MISVDRTFDAVVVGAGFGGLGAALRLAELGRSVVLLERVDDLGGCACTFQHEGDRFEGGATLFAGLAPGELFGEWIERHRLDVPILHLENPVELRAGAAGIVRAHRDRDRFVDAMCADPSAPQEALRRFFDLQARVADKLWALFDEPHLLPPLGWRAAWTHLGRAPRYAVLSGLVGRPLWSVVERFGLAEFAPLVRWLDAQCQITVQCSSREAEAPFALAALDYHHRGAAHVVGGIGVLAEALGLAFVRQGGLLARRTPVSRIEPADRRADGARWVVTARGLQYRARSVVLGVLPQVAARLVHGISPRAFDGAAARVRTGWGAAALFRVLRPPASADEGPFHLQLVNDPALPFLEGNHVFLSIGAAGEGVQDPSTRRATASTHVDLRSLRALDTAGRRARVEAVQAAMRATLAARAPEWCDVTRELTASPRTYARWVGRRDEGAESDLGGWVGGVPRRAGLGAYRDLFARPPAPGLHLVGDSVFPGQSILATALGGVRAAEILARATAAR